MKDRIIERQNKLGFSLVWFVDDEDYNFVVDCCCCWIKKIEWKNDGEDYNFVEDDECWWRWIKLKLIRCWWCTVRSYGPSIFNGLLFKQIKINEIGPIDWGKQR